MDSFFLEGQRKDVNLGRGERFAFAVSGAGLISWALARRKPWSIPLGLLGGALVYSGARGHSFLYQVLDIQRSGRGGVVIEHAVTIERPLLEVYQYWRNFENFPRFMRHLESVTVLDERRSHWVARAPLGTEVEWDAVIAGEQENEFISWHSLPGSTVENSGMVYFRPGPAGNGAEVRVLMEYYPVGGSTGAALATFLGEEPDRQIREDLLRLKQVLETGEFASVEGQPSGRKGRQR